MNVVEIAPLLPDAAEVSATAACLLLAGSATVAVLGSTLGARRVTVLAALQVLAAQGVVHRNGEMWTFGVADATLRPDRSA
jgi:predicted transcriptional regulator